MKLRTIAIAASFFITGQAFAAHDAAAKDAQDEFFNVLNSFCGQAFAGKVVVDNSDDPRFKDKVTILHVRDCGRDEIRMPMHVGDDHSRTFILTKTDAGIKLSHDHRHEDGQPDKLSLYGGNTAEYGTKWRQDFPVNDFSRQLFMANDLQASVANIWSISIIEGQSISYELRRPGREFRIDFDLNSPVENPPAAWGHQ